jgi:dUTP pyrophosphatase
MFLLQSPDAQVPSRATAKSVGYDLHALREVYLHPGIPVAVDTGVAIEWQALPNLHRNGLWEAQVRPRSGLALVHGITVLNAPGTIDGDFTDTIKVILINHKAATHRLEQGSRIAQLVFSVAYAPEKVETIRTGGLGSTNGF